MPVFHKNQTSLLPYVMKEGVLIRTKEPFEQRILVNWTVTLDSKATNTENLGGGDDGGGGKLFTAIINWARFLFK
jgi:hypothetical protein